MYDAKAKIDEQRALNALQGGAIVLAWGLAAIKWIGIILLYMVVYWSLVPMIDRWIQLATVGRIQ